MTSYHLIRVGAMGQIGRFEAVDASRYQRHHRVIVRTCRGLEIGEVLVPPEGVAAGSPTTGSPVKGSHTHGIAPDRVDGQILRGMTPQDQLLEARLEAKRQTAYTACVALLEQQQLPDLLIDVEHLFDGRGLFFYFLGEVTPELDRITRQLAETYEAEVQFRKFTETLLIGCGPGCGTEAAAGQGGCGSCSGCEMAGVCQEPITIHLAS